MKYDSGMTHFHKDIIAALRHMLKNNSEITEKFSPNDGSPAPLRDYLKEKYGKSYTSHIGNGMRYSCKTSTGFELTFDIILNNPGDKNLTLSWSQTAKFIRDNWDEVFKAKETAEKQPSYLDKLRERYPKINETDKWFDSTYCPNDIFDGENVNNIAEEDCEYGTKDENGCQKCWHSPCAADADFYEKLGAFEKDYYSHYPSEADTVPEISEEKSELNKSKPTYKDIFLEHCPDFDEGQFDEFIYDACLSEFFDDRDSTKCPEHHDCKICWYSECRHKWDITDEGEQAIKPYLNTQPVPTDTEPNKPAENQIIPKDTNEISNTFNYAVLSTEIGDYLKQKEQQLKNEYFKFICKWGEIFADAQEALAKHGFGENNGIFHKWFDSLNLPISRRTMYRMISVYKFRSCQIGTNEEVQKIFDSFPKTSQYEIAEGKVPEKLVEQVLSGDITTHKDYIALKKQLDEANKRAKNAEFHEKTISESYDRIEAANHEHYTNLLAEQKKNADLEKRIKELESHSVSVAVHKDESAAAEISRLKRELAKAQQDIIDASFGSSASGDTELISDFYETLHGSALSAIKSCADFAEKNGSKFIGRFRSLAEVINDCINEMEEF